jgi:hypothetical protein
MIERSTTFWWNVNKRSNTAVQQSVNHVRTPEREEDPAEDLISRQDLVQRSDLGVQPQVQSVVGSEDGVVHDGEHVSHCQCGVFGHSNTVISCHLKGNRSSRCDVETLATRHTSTL